MASCEETSPLGVVPYLLSPDCQKHLQWLENALGGKARQPIIKDEAKSKVMHCCVEINGGVLYMADKEQMEKPQTESSEVVDVNNLILHMDLGVENPHSTWKRAHAHGATTVMNLEKQSWGDIYGQFRDPFGFLWSISSGDGVGVVPYLLAPKNGSCEKMIQWVSDVFRGHTKNLQHWPDGRVMHSELVVNSGKLFMSDGLPDREEDLAVPTSPSFLLHINDCCPRDLWKMAESKGATCVLPLKLQDWGSLYGIVKDTMGFQWAIMEAKDCTPTSGLIPTFFTADCEKHIEWIKAVFDGKVMQLYYSSEQKGKVAHCMMEVNKGYLYLCDTACVLEEAKDSIGEPKGVAFQVETADPDPLWKKALLHGAAIVVPLKMQFWGEIFGTFNDPMGYQWAVRQPMRLAKHKDKDNKPELQAEA